MRRASVRAYARIPALELRLPLAGRRNPRRAGAARSPPPFAPRRSPSAAARPPCTHSPPSATHQLRGCEVAGPAAAPRGASPREWCVALRVTPTTGVFAAAAPPRRRRRRPRRPHTRAVRAAAHTLPAAAAARRRGAAARSNVPHPVKHGLTVLARARAAAARPTPGLLRRHAIDDLAGGLPAARRAAHSAADASNTTRARAARAGCRRRTPLLPRVSTGRGRCGGTRGGAGRALAAGRNTPGPSRQPRSPRAHRPLPSTAWLRAVWIGAFARRAACARGGGGGARADWRDSPPRPRPRSHSAARRHTRHARLFVRQPPRAQHQPAHSTWRWS